ncbi:MAG: NADPH-dependent FMN reductase [Flavobacteriales bacterium]|jgi:NAD(P)H-dependent FMN reductase|nr:MAG: NADPH-dependent FMN reductase [Flavobacteriales bacterium]
MHLVIISGSVREGRRSHRVAVYLHRAALSVGHSAEVIDLKACDFPLFRERLREQREPLPEAVDYAARVAKADGVVLVTPEYNGGYPASVKNAVDLLVDEWKRKPVAICTVSNGSFGGNQAITALVFTLWKVKAWVVAHMPVPHVQESFDEGGAPVDPEIWAKRSGQLIQELSWAMEARRRMEA